MMPTMQPIHEPIDQRACQIPANTSMQQPALSAAADAGRYGY